MRGDGHRSDDRSAVARCSHRPSPSSGQRKRWQWWGLHTATARKQRLLLQGYIVAVEYNRVTVQGGQWHSIGDVDDLILGGVVTSVSFGRLFTRTTQTIAMHSDDWSLCWATAACHATVRVVPRDSEHDQQTTTACMKRCANCRCIIAQSGADMLSLCSF